MDRKGFTLIEMLATFVILGVILLIAVPSINGLALKQKEKVYKADIDKFVGIAKYEKKKNPFFKDTICFSNNNTSCEDSEKTEIKIYDIENSPSGLEYTSGYVILSNPPVACLTDGKTIVFLNKSGSSEKYVIETGEGLSC